MFSWVNHPSCHLLPRLNVCITPRIPTQLWFVGPAGLPDSLVKPAEGTSEFLPAGIADSARASCITRIDAYYDIAPRATSRVEEYGSLVLFVAERGWPFYARPRLDRTTEPTTDEVRMVLARQSELAVPQSVEWIHQSAPSLADATREAGMTVHECPLLVLESLAPPRSPEGEVRLLDAEEAKLGTALAAVNVAGSSDAARRLGFTREALRDHRTVQVGAFVGRAGAVGGGSHNLRGDTSEIVGVGVLPAFRRRGLAGAVAHLLARHAIENGAKTVFCGAEGVDVARIYENVGFRLIGTTCVAGID